MKFKMYFPLIVLLIFISQCTIAQDLRIKCRWKNEYLHTQYAKPELEANVPKKWWSAMWQIEPIHGTNFVRIKCKWKNQYLHTQYGKPELKANVPKKWWSAMWQIEPIHGTGFVRIKCRWKNQYLHTQYGKPELKANVPKKWGSAMWQIEPLIKLDYSCDRIESFTPNPITNLCPNTKDHEVTGGRHFDSSVETTLSAYYTQADYRKHIKINLILRMKGRKSNLKARWDNNLLYTAPKGMFIKEVFAADRKFSFISNDYSKRTLPRAGGEFMGCNDGTKHRLEFNSRRLINQGLIKYANVIGDTGGEDISDDRNCHCDSKIIDVVFKPLDICLETESNYKKRIAKQKPVIIQ